MDFGHHKPYFDLIILGYGARGSLLRCTKVRAESYEPKYLELDAWIESDVMRYLIVVSWNERPWWDFF